MQHSIQNQRIRLFEHMILITICSPIEMFSFVQIRDRCRMVTISSFTSVLIIVFGFALGLPAVASGLDPYRTAQAELHYFKQALANPESMARARVMIELREDQKTEIFWLGQVHLDGEEFVGKLETIPRHLLGVQLGQEIRIQAKDVLDWNYQDRKSRIVYGNYNVCAELNSLPKREAKEQMAYWGAACKPKP
ncbi:DUF2314 domain-containing protein [Undibacterium amnicola]|uniref:DUF2314 domain-containing protein n=1 Tax=Undibacterium amnicola TaxID=1834038 RepID=A0ABR6XNK4_9BURK|nr:DUF2314 domain-containing protein [Undibacterium amnicola]MBC3830971.1 DUF2314 domain-containing protein [Undibacterium amnicola]